MNFTMEEGQTAAAKVNLDGNREYKVWGFDGLAQMGRSESISLTLEAGEAVFIEILGA